MGWQWDKSLFAGAAKHYLRGRVPYAPGFAEAIGLDPDEDMLAVAERRAARQGVSNVRWVCARAEDLPAGLDDFQAVMFASSFHWMDRDKVAATVLQMLEPGGALVHMSDLKEPPAASAPLPLPAPPYPRIGELIRQYLGPTRRAGQGVIASGTTPDREELVFARAGYGNCERLVVPAGPSTTASGAPPSPTSRSTGSSGTTSATKPRGIPAPPPGC